MKRPLKIVLTVFAFLVIVGVITFCVAEAIVIKASKGQNYENPDYVIVLGAKVDPWGPSRSLDDRLRAALAYMEEYPDCKAVVSGGQGPDEHISEAACMKAWLEEKGIAAERIIAEDESTSTRENLWFSTDMIAIDCAGDWRTQHVVILSSEYHLCRARYLGKELLDYDFGTYPAPTSLAPYKVRYYIREALGIVYTRLFYI